MFNQTVLCGERKNRSPQSHQDEFPAEYSLTSCTPAELASASSAKLMLKHKLTVGYCFSANGNCPQIRLSQLLTQATAFGELPLDGPGGAAATYRLRLSFCGEELSPYGRDALDGSNVRSSLDRRGDLFRISQVHDKHQQREKPTHPTSITAWCARFQVALSQRKASAWGVAGYPLEGVAENACI